MDWSKGDTPQAAQIQGGLKMALITAKERKRTKRNLLKKGKLKRLAIYPGIILNDADESVNTEFVEAVHQIVAGFQFNDHTRFSGPEQRFFENVRRVGLSRAIRKKVFYVEPKTQFHMAACWEAHLGEKIMVELKNRLQIEKYVPYNDFHIEFSGHNFIINFDALLSRHSKYGKIFYSRRAPKVVINNQEYTVAYSRHAIERYCQRTVGDPYSYGGSGDSFAYLAYCNRYDHHAREWNGKNKHYLSFYNDCKNGFVSGSFAREILAKEYIRNNSHAYRIGYLPVGLWNGFACSATLLVPGMKGTPEQILLKNADIDEDLRVTLIQANQFKLSVRECVENDMVGVLKWYHDNGVPQVINTGKTLFPRYI